MLSTVVLCLAALCSVHVAEGSDINTINMLNQMRRLQNEATSLSDDLRRTSNQLTIDVDTKLNEARVAHMASVRAIVEPALKDVTAASDLAQSQGREPSDCYNRSKREFDRALADGYNMLYACVDENTPTVNSVISALESTANAAQTVASGIANMILTCNSPITVLQNACLARYLPQANNSMRNVRYSAESARNAATPSLDRALSLANVCFPQKLVPLRPRVLNLRVEGLECIRGAL